ncbi:MAG: flap endonuclease-1, partial [Candidatus Aenigmatarchaeota archaeon]
AYNTLYQFLSIIRDRMTGQPLRDSQGRITSHLSGVLYRTSKLMETGITPVFVFDGKPPDFKKSTIEGRQKIRDQARERWKKAIDEGRHEEARIAATASARLTKEMIDEAKELLRAMGVSWIQAPSEGEAQAARMVIDGQAYASASQDWDSLLFGTPRMLKNVTISGKKKVPRKEKYIDVKPEIIELGSALKDLGITQGQLIAIGILTGTDYNPGGIKGLGPKGALKLVKEKGSFSEVIKDLEWSCETSPEQIYDFFIHPPTERAEIPKWKADPDKVREFMLSRSFSEERINNVLERLEGAKKIKQQTGLGAFLGR